MASVKVRARYEEILALPEHLVGEILDGDLHVMSRPAPRHIRASSRLGNKLGPPFDEGDGGPGGWWILDEPEVHLGEDVLVPDLAGWRRERMPVLPEASWFGLAPDWICEVLSPSTSRDDRTKKLPIYAREAVRWAWLVDPLARTVEVLRLQGTSWLIVGAYADDQVVHAEPFEAIAFPLASLWA